MTVQPDLFGGWDAADQRERQATRDRWHQAAANRLYRIRKRWRPDTGEDLGPGHVWCGRCGGDGPEYPMSINHDLGYLGCPTDRDGRLHRRPMTIDDLCDRWDRRFYPDCATCGHSWGIHPHDQGGGEAYGIGCAAYCRCPRYTPAARPAVGRGAA